MITLNIGNLCKLRNIQQPLPTLVKAGISRTVAYDYIRGNRKFIQLKHIEILCKLLNCMPQDLFVWVPNADEADQPDNPLQAIRKKELPDMIAVVKKMTVQQLKELAEKK